MVSPHLIRKNKAQLSLNSDIKKIFQLIYIKKNKLEETGDGSSFLAVSEMVSKLSFIYEKVRNAVDYEDDHLLRKNAIKRIFRRQILIEGMVKSSKGGDISYHLLTELIQAGYLKNNSIPSEKVGEISLILEKYIRLKDYCFEKKNFLSSFINLSSNKKETKKRTNKAKNILLNWIIALAASEVEDNLTDDNIQREMVVNMFGILKDTVKLPGSMPYKDDLNIQIYLSIARNFMNFDDDLLSFVLFKYYNKDWSSTSDDFIKKVANDIDVLHLAVSNQLKHPLSRQLDRITKPYSLYFSVLRGVVDNNPIKVYDYAINNNKAFTELIKEYCEERYRKIKNKLWRSGLRSIIYIFITKSIFVVLLEIPAVKFFGEDINLISLAINISFPAFLLFVMILFTWSPAKENTDKIIKGIESVVFTEKSKKDFILPKAPVKRSLLMAIVFNTIYLAGFMISMILIIKFLVFIEFNWVSIIIFLFFLMFVSFFSFRIKRDIKKFIIVEPRERTFGFLFDFLYTPIVAVGKFLSDNASKVNIFIFVLDFIIEAPFKVFVEIFDDWVKYVRERKDNLVN